ncbi:MAG: 30S ribosome-binding factor RbfA [Eubacteriales bacterium]|nr:30S ribosome-binding factor RbfA [Eubacteriales bacterium]
MKKGSIKNNRINGEVMRELSSILREVKDPRVDPLLSITRVEVTPDLQFCKCFISTFTGGDSLERSVEGLRSAEGYIRRELAQRVNLRKTPKLQFVEDRSIEYGVEMAKRIEELAEEDRRRHPHAEETEEAD